MMPRLELSLMKYRNPYEIMRKGGVRFLRKLIIIMVTYTSVSDITTAFSS